MWTQTAKAPTTSNCLQLIDGSTMAVVSHTMYTHMYRLKCTVHTTHRHIMHKHTRSEVILSLVTVIRDSVALQLPTPTHAPLHKPVIKKSRPEMKQVWQTCIYAWTRKTTWDAHHTHVYAHVHRRLVAIYHQAWLTDADPRDFHGWLRTMYNLPLASRHNSGTTAGWGELCSIQHHYVHPQETAWHLWYSCTVYIYRSTLSWSTTNASTAASKRHRPAPRHCLYRWCGLCEPQPQHFLMRWEHFTNTSETLVPCCQWK